MPRSWQILIETPAAYNQIFNIGASQPYSVKDLAGAIAKSMEVDPNITFVPARNEVAHAYSSHEKIQGIFGEREMHSLEDGLARMAHWVHQHGARESSEFENIEIMKNLPEAWLS